MARTSPAQFVREVRQELSKVTWPTRKELIVTTASVFAMAIAAALFFLGRAVDFGNRWLMAARWYIIHVYSGFEKKVMHSIREQAIQQGLEHLFEEILVPMEEVVEVKRGKKVSAERKFFPGYVLVKMELTDETWHLVRNTAKVTGFLSSGGRPVPIPDAEAERILRQMQEGIEHPRPLVTFMSGDQVRVVDGPFSSFNGLVEDVDEGKGRLKVSVSIFGRATPVELEYSQVEKL
jgi:transcription termination/antitermination protein NusG